jgi:hypothetical protein
MSKIASTTKSYGCCRRRHNPSTGLQSKGLSFIGGNLPHNLWKRWSGERLAQVAMAQGLVSTISPSPIRRWLGQDKIKPWRYHSWPQSTDPQFVEKAAPVLELYERAPELAAAQPGVCCVDEKTSIPARPRVHKTKLPSQATPCKSPIAIGGWAPCSCSVACSWLRTLPSPVVMPGDDLSTSSPSGGRSLPRPAAGGSKSCI